MPDLKGRLFSNASYEWDEPVSVGFALANNEDQDLYVLTWYTPLEGLFSDCLEVLRDGLRLPYDGVLAKRGEPTTRDYLLVPARGEVSILFDLGGAYDVSEPGNYKVALDTRIHDFFVPSATGSLAELINENRQPVVGPRLDDGEIWFSVTENEKVRRLTKGLQARRLSPPASEEAAPPEFGPREPNVNGGTAENKEQARQAHFDGYNLCVAALAALTNDARYREWFGLFSDQRLQTVRDNFTRIKNQIESRTFTYSVNGPDCRIDMHAYTHKGITQIWLCDLFWNSPTVGADSKASTLLHEHSHASASTNDGPYNRNDCRLLAQASPDKAIMNASNYEYFAVSI